MAKVAEQMRIIEQPPYTLRSEMTADLDELGIATCLAAMMAIRDIRSNNLGCRNVLGLVYDVMLAARCALFVASTGEMDN